MTTSQSPLQGATVRVGSQTTQTRPDGGLSPHRGSGRDGHPAGDDDRLRARSRVPVTVAAGETLDMDIGLAPQAVELAELVVVGYGEQRQGNITGAVTNVTSEEFNTGRIVSPHRADPEQGGRASRWSRTTSPAARPPSGSAAPPRPPPATSRSTSSTGSRSATGAGADLRARPAQLPESRRHRQHDGAARRRRRRRSTAPTRPTAWS